MTLVTIPDTVLTLVSMELIGDNIVYVDINDHHSDTDSNVSEENEYDEIIALESIKKDFTSTSSLLYSQFHFNQLNYSCCIDEKGEVMIQFIDELDLNYSDNLNNNAYISCEKMASYALSTILLQNNESRTSSHDEDNLRHFEDPKYLKLSHIDNQLNNEFIQELIKKKPLMLLHSMKTCNNEIYEGYWKLLTGTSNSMEFPCKNIITERLTKFIENKISSTFFSNVICSISNSYVHDYLQNTAIRGNEDIVQLDNDDLKQDIYDKLLINELTELVNSDDKLFITTTTTITNNNIGYVKQFSSPPLSMDKDQLIMNSSHVNMKRSQSYDEVNNQNNLAFQSSSLQQKYDRESFSNYPYSLLPGYYDKSMIESERFNRFFNRFSDSIFVAGIKPIDIVELIESNIDNLNCK